MFVYCNNKGEKLSSKTEIKLICIPGVRPVKIPAVIPRTIAIKISKTFLSLIPYYFI